MAERVDTLLKACKCGCGKEFVPKRKDQLFYKDHKAAYNKNIYDVGKELVEKFGTDVSVDNIKKVDWPTQGIRVSPFEADAKKKKTFNARNIEGSKPLKRMLNLFLKGGSHSTMALNNRLTVTCGPTMASEINWNFNKRTDLPKEYHKYKGMEIISSTKRIKNKTVWFYKLASPFAAFENKIVKGMSRKLGLPVTKLTKPIPKRG